ncbi:MAG: hypothetical protein ABSE74_03205 [Methanoregula sp.]|jgi:hypothetical protein
MGILYKIRCDVPIPVNWFNYAPIETKDWLNLQIQDKIVAHIGLNEASPNFLRPKKNEDGQIVGYFNTNLVTIELEGYWPEEIAEILRKFEVTKLSQKEETALKTFQSEIRTIIQQISENLIKNIRNHFGQWWISENIPYDENSFNTILWLDSDGKWKLIGPKIVFVNFNVHITGLSKYNWYELGERLKNNTKPDMIDIMIANAFAHIDNNNGRIAIVEAVASLEATIKRCLPSLLAQIADPQIPENLLDHAVEKMGLRLTTNIFFTHLSKKVGLDPNDCLNCLDAIDIRNKIIHNQKRTVTLEKARDDVSAIYRIITSIKNYKN